ncbi:polyamine aminopropyltransferase [Allopusillimonas soli]|uniref:Polyamine aminopropyltransferase n=1 Tax=Allopusillimonas soli TaxID=659016 RepID=A0A853F4K3_9BURK|nr:polyamine aminopropyltransferase [Allopusillimonas soli]NYT35405.1 polyamine aminopropyltransferase [Allopusillimonas soli]TEA75820.1 polyamine aminopropyltransferase [Allopusillimonas soli]
MQGLHLTADLYLCACDSALLINANTLADLCRQHTLDAGLTLVAEKWHTFPDFQGEPGGVTGMLLLAESHLALHTWPERGGITLDVYVCNFMEDNSAKAEQLLEALVAAFMPGTIQRERLLRGDENGPGSSGELTLEPLNQTSVYGFRFNRRLHARQTAYQRLEVLESAELGRTLRLDDHFMTSEADEFFYHEALVHPAAMAHDAPRRALVVGGGDGGALDELLKHPSIEHITLVELDGEVIDAARTYLQNIHHGAFDDPRVCVKVQDGAQYLAAAQQASQDLILLDLTDPETPAGPLYTREFFAQCQRVLAPGGALVLHLGTPFHEPAQVRELAQALSAVFPQVHGYGVHIPLYGTYWALALASNDLDPTAISPARIEQRLDDRGITGLQYYNADVHGALFALPNYYRKLMPKVRR